MSDALWQKARWLAGWVTRMSMDHQAVSAANEILEGPESLPESAQPAERAGEWVSVEERLPEENEAVLVVECENATPEPYVAYREDGRWRVYTSAFAVHGPTHWMPLPPPPQPKGEA